MNCYKFTHDIDEILENPMIYLIRYVLLMETCLKRFISGIISQYLNVMHSKIAIGVFRIPGGRSRHITMLHVESSDTGSWPPSKGQFTDHTICFKETARGTLIPGL